MNPQSRRFSVAPMMDWTDRHCRAFHRVLTRHALLYTEMVTTGALIHGPRARLLRHGGEGGLALQLGGSVPHELATCSRMGEDAGYDEINLNVGCPSDRVQNGRFGACLMAEPERVAESCAAMRDAVRVPVTVKCRIGIDEDDPEVSLRRFVHAVAGAGVNVFIVHARKAWLSGLSPKENRDVPPLDYALVRTVKAENPALTFVLNGGVRTLDEALQHLTWADGVMMGRAAYEAPAQLAEVDQRIFGDGAPVRTVWQAIEAFTPYLARELREGTPLAAMTRHMLGLFNGQPGARAFRRILSQEAHKPHAGIEIFQRACAQLAQTQAEAA